MPLSHPFLSLGQRSVSVWGCLHVQRSSVPHGTADGLPSQLPGTLPQDRRLLDARQRSLAPARAKLHRHTGEMTLKSSFWAKLTIVRVAVQPANEMSVLLWGELNWNWNWDRKGVLNREIFFVSICGFHYRILRGWINNMEVKLEILDSGSWYFPQLNYWVAVM